MDENTKKIQREIAKDKIQVILASIAVAVLIVMELYIMINFKSNFMFMAVGILLMIVALFFLISAVLDMSLKAKDMEEQKYEEIYNAQKASYLVIKKSFDELDARLRNIEESSTLPAEDIINAQKAVAKVTISRSKENTDALMNSNDELINQLLSMQEKIDRNNDSLLEKQQSLIKETNFDIQQKITDLASKMSIMEEKIQSKMAVLSQPIQVAPVIAAPVQQPVQMQASNPLEMQIPNVPSEPQMQAEEPAVEEPIPGLEVEQTMEEIPDLEAEAPSEDLGLDLDSISEEPVEDVGLDIDMVTEEPSEDLGLDIDAVTEEPTEDVGLDIDAVTEEPVEDLGIDIDAMSEETLEEIVTEEPVEEAPVEEMVAEDLVEEAPVEEMVAEEPVEEATVEEMVAEEPVEEATVEEIVTDEPAIDEAPEEIELSNEPIEESEEIILSNEPAVDGVDLDALLEEVGGPVEEDEPPKEEEPVEEEKTDEIVIPDVGVDLTDPNRVMSAEEIEKLFASI